MKRTILALIFLCCGCGKMQGTGTGNPMHLGDGAEFPLTQTVTYQVLEAVCSRVQSCTSATLSACRDAVNSQSTFAEKMGYPDLPTPSGLALQYFESTGQITAAEGPAITCLHKLNTLACASSEVQNAYLPGTANPFARASEMLSTECAGIFGP